MQAFEEAYKTLNKAQKQAVDAVEGPVLVIAGPGTGKTHILTLRIANILKVTQANPSNILALTFTDSAARTIRERLKELIGETTAREVNVFTFHSFCDYVLKEYPDHFPSWAGKRLAGDVESALLWREVLETEPIVRLRTPKSPFHHLKDLSGLNGNLIRERVSLADYRAWAAGEEKKYQADETLRYVRGEKKGELKPEGVKKIERLEKAYEAIRLIEAYEALKSASSVYDFNDVLRGVVDTIQEDEALRTVLQEQFQYVLADEHQDANAYQHALLDGFAYDDHPNLFVVGDEKQAIFRFQGADSVHFDAFTNKYPRTQVVRLTESRRSLQAILDAAHTLALERIPSTNGEHVPLGAHRTGTGSISLLVAPDPLAELEQVATLVAERIASGVEPSAIAIISARNATADRASEHLRAKHIPTLRAGDVSLDSRPFVRATLALMRAIADPLDTASLREALLSPHWSPGLPERAAFLRTTRNHELLARLRDSFPDVTSLILSLQKRVLAEPPLEAFSRILEASGIRAYALSRPEHLEDIPFLRKLYGFVEETVARNHAVSFADAIASIGRAHELGLEWVKSSELFREGCVTVITAHKAKGMEFSQVFIVGMTENEWEKGGRGSLLPSPVDFIKSADDAVKQFYVALTRAKDSVVLSYSSETLEGRERKPSALIPQNLPRIEAKSDPLPLLHHDVDAPKLVCELTRAYLLGDGLYPSALEDYLESPAAFFAKRVLRLKEPEQPAMLIGNAVHAGIAAYLTHKSEDKAHAALNAALSYSLLARNAVYETAAEDARKRLAAFITHADTLGTPKESEKIYAMRRTFSGVEVQLAGKLDAVFERDSTIRLIDFKTSSQVKGKEKDFELQLAYYDLLLRGNNVTPSGASIVQVRPDGITEFPIAITKEKREELQKTLEEAVPEMLSGKWRTGEPSEYDAILELFR